MDLVALFGCGGALRGGPKGGSFWRCAREKAVLLLTLHVCFCFLATYSEQNSGDVSATVVLLPGHWFRVAGIREHRPKTLKGHQNKHSRLSGSIPDSFRNIEKLTDAGKMQLEIEMGGVKDKEPIQATV